jgi:signal transduction histidine kinase
MVSVMERVSRVIVAVVDTGTGIDADGQVNLFKRSMHGADRNQARGERVGLGLVIARRVVELHRGSITVQSQLGQGSRFEFYVHANYEAFTDAAH